MQWRLKRKKYVFTMDENMDQRLLHNVPTELAIAQSALPPSSEFSEGGQCVHAAIHSKFQGPTCTTSMSCFHSQPAVEQRGFFA
jgi:hypothetical protein